MHTGRLALLAAFTLGTLGTLAGCNAVECGANTIEQNGKCVPAMAPANPAAECGPGTVYSTTTGRCEAEIFANGGGACGPNTSVVVSDAGVRTCVGTGGGGNDCSVPLPCPAPSGSGNVSLCGRVYDLEDTKPLDDGNPDNGEPWKTVELRVYDPIAFVANPAGARPIVKALPDSCGRFAILEVERPSNGFIAVATEDVTGADGMPTLGDNLVQTGIAAPATAGVPITGMRAFIFKRTLDQTWSTAAGLTGGNTFGKMGVYIPIFVSGTAAPPFLAGPTSGVTIAQVDPATGTRTPHPMNDYYFDDTDPLTRRMVSSSRAMTGANGTGLYVMSGLSQFSGTGGNPNGLCWAKDLAAAPVGGAYVQERIAAAEYCP
jgi:hypothetical protein